MDTKPAPALQQQRSGMEQNDRLDALQAQFGIIGRVSLEQGRNDLPLVRLNGRHGQALVSLEGGQVIDYTPTGQPPLLWLSQQSRFQPATPIRGGIPICWPWFGDHPDHPQLPAHGFARISRWQLLETRVEGDSTYLQLGLDSSAESRALWPHDFQLRLSICLDQQLTLTLSSRNTGGRPFTITEALHSYFRVGDIEQLTIHGLEGFSYRDKLQSLQEKTQVGDLRISAETDRVYLDSASTVRLSDSSLQRQIHVAKRGSLSTVVWNPWDQKARAMVDFDDQGFRQMVCIETANALSNRIELAPGTSHQLSCILSSEAG